MMEENQVEGLSSNDNPVLHQLQVFWINVLGCWFQELRPDFSGQESRLLIEWYKKADSNEDFVEKGNAVTQVLVLNQTGDITSNSTRADVYLKCLASTS